MTYVTASADRPLADRPLSGALSAQELRIVDAALRCVSKWGLTKTSLEDVAREAGCSRATVYRLFPGGKEALIESVVGVELDRFFTVLGACLDRADGLEGMLVEGINAAGEWMACHGALRTIVSHEPEILIRRVSFSEMDQILAAVSGFCRPYLLRWFTPDDARKVAEWVTRLVLSYSACPAEGVELADRQSVQRLVSTFVLPGIRALVDSQEQSKVSVPAAG